MELRQLLWLLKWQWIFYGVAAYYGLKLLKQWGVFPKQTGAAVDLIDQGVDIAKKQIGLDDHSKFTNRPIFH